LAAAAQGQRWWMLGEVTITMEENDQVMVANDGGAQTRETDCGGLTTVEKRL